MDYLEMYNRVQLIRRGMNKQRIFRDRPNPYDTYSPVEFRQRYRFSKQSMKYITDIVRDKIKGAERSNGVSAEFQVLIAVKYFATNSFQQVVGDISGLTNASVCRIVHRVARAIAEIHHEFIKFPSTTAELNGNKEDFLKIGNFPNVIGAIDGTHIRIQNPGGEDALRFINRKGYYSINCQFVCDAHCKFQNIVARWPGSTHDARIFENSSLKNKLEQITSGYLLGDSGYPCRTYLLTPVLNPKDRAEHLYNTSHIKTRNTIERAFGILKRRFSCLSTTLRVRLEHAFPIIVACAVLHNIAIILREPLESDTNINNEEVQEYIREANAAGNAKRALLIHTWFAAMRSTDRKSEVSATTFQQASSD